MSMEFAEQESMAEEQRMLEADRLREQQLMDAKAHLGMLEHYGIDETIPKEVRESKWAIFSKSLTYTFLDEKDLPMIDIHSQILKVNTLTSMPPHLLTYAKVDEINQMETYMYFTAKRAMGTNINKQNERTLQVTQIGQSISTQANAPQGKPMSVSGFMSKVRRLI